MFAAAKQQSTTTVSDNPVPACAASVTTTSHVTPHIISPAAATTSNEDTFFENAAHHNADGVVSLQRGDCGRAFQSFVTTLTILGRFRHYLMGQDDDQTPPPPPPRVKNCKAISVPYLEDNAFSIYNHAVIFSRKPRIIIGGGANTTTTSESSWQLDTIAFCEAIAKFNLGLAYHQRGTYCGEDKTLLGALELYEQSLATLQSIIGGGTTEIKVLQLAAMNNRIHILNAVARFRSAQLLVDELLLQSVNALAVNEGNALSFLTRADIDNFLLNALVMRRFNTAPCA